MILSSEVLSEKSNPNPGYHLRHTSRQYWVTSIPKTEPSTTCSRHTSKSGASLADSRSSESIWPTGSLTPSTTCPIGLHPEHRRGPSTQILSVSDHTLVTESRLSFSVQWNTSFAHPAEPPDVLFSNSPSLLRGFLVHLDHHRR